MAIITDITHFLTDGGVVPGLPKPAMKLFSFITRIVEAVSLNVNDPIIELEMQCCDRGAKIECNGHIDAWCNDERVIEWVCCKCSESGTISKWQKTKWDMQKNTLH
jgi:hypothetical protein